MKLGCCSWSHHRTFESGAMNIFDWMNHCADELRVGGIEITDGHLHETADDYLAEVKRVACELHLTISAVTVSNDFGKSEEKDITAALERVERVIKITHLLGSPILRVFAGWPDTNKKEQWDAMVRCMKISCLLAERDGITLAVENHNHGGFIQTAADVEKLFTDVDSPWLRLNLDTNNYIDGYPSIEQTVRHAVQVHAKMLKVGPDGSEANLDYPKIIALLRENNYRGFVSIEYEGEEDELTAVARGVNYLRRLINAQD